MENNPCNEKQEKYTISKEDRDFFYSDGARGLRLQVDYLKAEEKMKAEGIHHTVVVFGSARTPEDNINYIEARKFGSMVGCSGDGPKDCYLTLMTGGGPGIMEAANRGANDVGAKSIGLNIKLPHEQYPNPYISPELSFNFYYFGIRKLHFIQRAKALVVFPGGFGTLDELFEILTLIQTGKKEHIPIVLVNEAFWKNSIDIDYLVKEETISANDLNLFTYANDANTAWEQIIQWYKVRKIDLF
ncbi:hypothetical protein MNB_SV-5-1168 [hydrothermal vent metagenome]|uniref:Cytokinin riboside 5'-monophosphate phosphoribohydrolase n=1 Tax=hydrothermal vent metagenome TaxID=652676 RepID=A0A1W1EDG4_9ZZZZ